MLTPERKTDLQREMRRMDEQWQQRTDDLWSEWVWEFQMQYGLSDEEMEEIT